MHYCCPNGCATEVDTPFYYPPSCLPPEEYELGVLVYPDLSISNRWHDGVVGIPQEIREWLDSHDCLPHCIECNEEIIEEEKWQ